MNITIEENRYNLHLSNIEMETLEYLIDCFYEEADWDNPADIEMLNLLQSFTEIFYIIGVIK